MERAKYIRPGATVELSDTAAMQSSTGDFYSAFVRNSYIARVSIEDGRVILVSLPPGARHRDVEEVVAEAVEAAVALPPLPDGGAVFL